jgi:chemotaxis protein methyltransferase CheR
MPGGVFDLVLCRNLVFTYFEASLQVALLERLLQRMAPSAVLLIGAHETRRSPTGE